MLAAEETIRGWTLLAAVVILCREILVSGLREYLAELRVSVPVTRLAKWKTVGQMVAIGFLIAGEAGDQILPVVTQIGIAAAVAVGAADALHRLGLHARRPALYDRRMKLKIRYFAWVRERIGKPEEDVELPAACRHGRRTDRPGSPRAARNMPMPSRTRR